MTKNLMNSMRVALSCLVLGLGLLVVVPSSASAASCTASYGGSIKWGGGKIYGYATAKNCSTTKYTKVCAYLYYSTYASQGLAKANCSGKMGRYTSVGTNSGSKPCYAGYYSVQVRATLASGKVVTKMTRQVDTTGGCKKSGSSSAT